MQAVLNPASARPKAAYKPNLEISITYSEASTAGTDNESVVGVIDNSVVTNLSSALKIMVNNQVCDVRCEHLGLNYWIPSRRNFCQRLQTYCGAMQRYCSSKTYFKII
mgnify:CR=1 FL=1